MSGKSKRGFASMSPDKQREIASKGGKAAHAKGTAHEFTPEEARAAGRKGGQAAHRKRAEPPAPEAEAPTAFDRGDGAEALGYPRDADEFGVIDEHDPWPDC